MPLFTQKKVDALKYSGKDQRIRAGDNLYINITATGARYMFRVTREGTTRSKALGSCNTLSLKAAKELVYTLRYAKPEPISVTFAALACDYMDENERAGKTLILSRIAIINKAFGRTNISDITRLKVVEFIRAYRSRSASNADQLLILMRTILNHGVATGVLDENIAKGIPRSASGYKPVVKSRTLNHDEIRWLWTQGNANARVSRFLLVSGLRVNEGLNGSIDGDKFRCIAKGSRPHWIHLTDLAREQLPFPERRTSTVVGNWLRRCQPAFEDKFTPHDCRRTFATLANENGVEPFIVERCLNHKLPGVMAVYNHAEYKAERVRCAEIVEQAVLTILDELPDFLK